MAYCIPSPDAWAARLLLRAAQAGTLATADDGQPYAALVTPACMPDGALVVLLSDLSEHTRHLAADPRCALLVTGTTREPNPQTMPRVSVQCSAARDGDPALRRRYLAVHPYAALYAGFADFAIWRLAPLGGRFVGGFARAATLERADLMGDPSAAAAIVAAEAGIIAHCNNDHSEALARIAGDAGGLPAEWQMVTADTEGCHLAAGEQILRVAWQGPVSEPADIRAELIRLARR